MVFRTHPECLIIYGIHEKDGEKKQDVVNKLQQQIDLDQINDDGGLTLVKYLLYIGAMTNNAYYLQEAVWMVKQQYAVIPHIFMLESMHVATTALLIAGSVRAFANGDTALLISAIVFRYYPAEFPYKSEIARIYLKAASLVKSEEDKENLTALAKFTRKC